jgi:hypothetical protein
MIKKGKETFSGYNKPKRTPNHPTKSHAVLAKDGDQEKLIRFGQKAHLQLWHLNKQQRQPSQLKRND